MQLQARCRGLPAGAQHTSSLTARHRRPPLPARCARCAATCGLRLFGQREEVGLNKVHLLTLELVLHAASA